MSEPQSQTPVWGAGIFLGGVKNIMSDMCGGYTNHSRPRPSGEGGVIEMGTSKLLKSLTNLPAGRCKPHQPPVSCRDTPVHYWLITACMALLWPWMSYPGPLSGQGCLATRSQPIHANPLITKESMFMLYELFVNNPQFCVAIGPLLCQLLQGVEVRLAFIDGLDPLPVGDQPAQLPQAHSSRSSSR